MCARKVSVGDVAPDFTLPDKDGNPVALHDFSNKKNVVVYFYPKDGTPGCTAEALAFRDRYEVFLDAGAEVVGISGDAPSTHQTFAADNKLPFILLSDEGNHVRDTYGAVSPLSIPGRVTYIIDKKGIVRHIFSSQLQPKKHIDEALKILEAIK